MGAADRIADTMLEAGRIQAQGIRDAAAMRYQGAQQAAQGQAGIGQLWGGTLAHLGAQLGAIPGALQQDAAQRQEGQLRQQQVAEGQMRIKAQQEQEQARQALNGAMQNAIDPQTGQLNHDLLIRGLTQAGHADLVPTLQKSWTESAELQQKTAQGEADLMGAHGNEIKSLLDNGADAPTAGAVYLAHVAELAHSGALSMPRATELTARIKAAVEANDPAALGALASSQVVQSEKATKAQQNLADARKAMQAPNPVGVDTVDAQGHPVKAFVVPTPGLVVPQQEAPASQEPLVSVKTMENGKPVEKFIPRSEASGKTFASQPPASVIYPNPQGDQAVRDVKDAVSGIKEGSIPPILPSRASKEYVAIMAESRRQGVDLVKANEDWNATQKYLSTMNGDTQVRFRQAVKFAGDSLPLVQELAAQWDAGRFPALNHANLSLAKNGAFGQKAASIATKLDAQISDLTSELGTVYKGGNSSTDESLKLAAKNLSADWSKQTLMDNISQIQRNIAIRQNSIRFGAPLANEGNVYEPKTGAPPAGAKADPLGIR